MWYLVVPVRLAYYEERATFHPRTYRSVQPWNKASGMTARGNYY